MLQTPRHANLDLRVTIEASTHTNYCVARSSISIRADDNMNVISLAEMRKVLCPECRHFSLPQTTSSISIE